MRLHSVEAKKIGYWYHIQHRVTLIQRENPITKGKKRKKSTEGKAHYTPPTDTNKYQSNYPKEKETNA